MKRIKQQLALLAGLGLLVPARVFAQAQTWTPLITAEHFTGIKTDVGTAIAGIILLILIIAGAALLKGVLMR